jgi:hypothetical protein
MKILTGRRTPSGSSPTRPLPPREVRNSCLQITSELQDASYFGDSPQCAGIWQVEPNSLAAYNAASLDEKKRSVLDYSATDFLRASWDGAGFMSPNIQDVPFDPLKPNAQFPTDFYDGNWTVTQPSSPYSAKHFWYNRHPGNMMEASIMLEVCGSPNAPSPTTFVADAAFHGSIDYPVICFRHA